MAKRVERRVWTNEVRFSYPRVFEPSGPESMDAGKYSCALLIPKTDLETISLINEAIYEARTEGLMSKFGGKDIGLKIPLRDGDLEKPDDEAYAGMWFLNAKSKTKPGILNRLKQPITDPSEFYGGCYGIALISLYPYAVPGSKGIGVGLEHLLKTRDGEAFSGGITVSEAFEGIDFGDTDMADLEGMLK